MPLLKAWERIKKPVVVGLSIITSLFACFLILHVSDGAFEIILAELQRAFYPLVIVATTLSVVLFNYIDSISKDISVIDAEHLKVKIALESLSELKKEVIVNAVLIFVLLLIDLAATGITKFISPENIPFEYFDWVVMSARFSIFVLAIMAAVEQIRGLLVAIDYRSVIHAGKSK